MALPETLVRSRSAIVFLKEESTAGTFAGLPVSTDAFALTAVPTIAQAGNYTDTSEIGSELITTKKVLNYMDYATFDMEFYAKPSGTAGTVPAEDALMLWFFGKKTTSGNNNVTYSLANVMKTFTTWSQQFTDESYQLYVGQGCVPTTWGVSLAKDGPVTFSMGIQSNKVLYAGTAEISAIGADDSGTGGSGFKKITLDSPKRTASSSMVSGDVMFNGMQVDILDASASPAFSSAVASDVAVTDVTADQFDVINATTSPADGDLVVPSLPTADCQTESAMDQRSVSVYMGTTPASGTNYSTVLDIDGSDSNANIFHADNKINVTAVSVDVDRSLSTPGLTEMTGDEYPAASYVINEPTVSGSMTLLLRPKDFQMLSGLRAVPVRSLGIEIGSTAGSKIQIAAPAVHFEVPTPGEADGAVQIDATFTVVKQTDCEDEDKFIVRYI